MDQEHESMYVLRKSFRFLVSSLLPGVILHTFPGAVLILSLHGDFLLMSNRYGLPFGSSVGLLLFLCGIFLNQLFLFRIRNRFVSDLISVSSAAHAMIGMLPPWLNLLLSGVAISGFFRNRTPEQRDYLLYGVAIASLSGCFFGAAWFYPLAWNLPLLLCALSAFALASVLSALPGIRAVALQTGAFLLCIVLPLMISLRLMPVVSKINVKSTYTPYGVLYAIPSAHGIRVFSEDQKVLKNGDIAPLRMSILPAVLQCRGENCRALYVGYTPSELPGLLRRMPNIQAVSVLSFSGDFAKPAVTESPARTLHRFQEDFDLIFVAELPPCEDAAKSSFLNLLKCKLKEDGALVIPKEIHPAGIGEEPLAGTRGYMTIYRRGMVIRTWAQLEARFNELCSMSDDGFLSPALLDALKSETYVPKAASSQAVVSDEFLRSLQPAPTWTRWLQWMMIAYLPLRFLIGRKGQRHFFFAAMENGFSLAVMLLAGVCVFSRYSLDYSFFPEALLLLIFLAGVRSRIPWLCRLFRLSYLLAISYLLFPVLRMNFDPMAVLSPLLVLGAAGSGVILEGIAARGKTANGVERCWMLWGAMLGSLFFLKTGIEQAWLLLAFSLFCRVLYMIRM